MDIVCISDTHNRHEDLLIPDGDILIHAGDFTEGGTEREVVSFLNWFAKLPHPHKICIAGNHDFFMQRQSAESLQQLIPDGVTYLKDESCTIAGIHFWGSPYTPKLDAWAFAKTNEDLQQHWEKIPESVDVLITHTPPYNILDESANEQALGCGYLRKRVKKVQPAYHIFGHMHNNYGLIKFDETTYINATSFNDAYQLTNNPIKISW